MKVLSVENLSIRLPETSERPYAVKGASFDLQRGETLCVIGESGSGKSTLAMSLMGLLDPAIFQQESGEIMLYPEDGAQRMDHDTGSYRGKVISMVFQEPSTALNPLLSCGYQVDEVLRRHTRLSRKQRRDKVLNLFEKMSLPSDMAFYHKYPHQLSGGQKQRILITMAVILEPSVLVCDEPTTALDVTTQKQILDLIKQIQTQLNMAVIFITHDIRIVSDIADKVLVMKDGIVVESGSSKEIIGHPDHPYTRHLVNMIPRVSVYDETASSAPSERMPLALCLNSVGKQFGQRSFLDLKKSVFVALQDISFDIRKGEILGVVGESGSGKSTLARCISGLLPVTCGEISKAPEERSSSTLTQSDLRSLCQMIFQDPYRSFNPSLTVEDSLIEGLLNKHMPRQEAVERTRALLNDVSLDAGVLKRHPRAFSGGQRQRLSIVRALLMEPDILVADEATSALDVSTQSTFVDLLLRLRDSRHLSILFITHDLVLASTLCDRLLVLKHGEIQELGVTQHVIHHPQSEYTAQLLEAIPGRALTNIADKALSVQGQGF